MHFVVERAVPMPLVCSGCGSVYAGGIHSTCIIRVEDLPISGKREVRFG